MKKPYRLTLRETAKSLIQATNDKLLCPLGVKLVNSRRPTRNFTDFFNHLKRLRITPRTIIDVGVGWGTNELYRAFPSTKFFLIEPLEEYSEYIKSLKSRYDIETVLAAAGKVHGEIVLNLHEDLRLTTALPRAAVERRTVPVLKLDDIFTGRQLEPPVLLKIDAEGQELSILDGANLLLPILDVLILESRFISYVEGLPEFGEVVDYMARKHFVVYDLLDGGYRPLDGALEVIDVVFVRTDSVFRVDKRFTESAGTDSW